MVKKPTSTDVARLAGVSQSSVSLILNGSDKVSFSSETKERVFAAAKELGYQPKHQRRILRQRGDLILVLTPTLSNPYYCELSQAIEGYAASRQYHAVICNTFRKPEMEKYYLESFAGGRVGGVIYTFLPSFPKLVERLAEEMQVILIGEKKNDLAICSIELSNRAAGEALAEHLYRLDHRDVTFISTPTNQTTLSREQRLEGMRDFFARQGLEGCVHVMEADCGSEEDAGDGEAYEYRVAKKLTERFLASGSESTALIGANDMIAIGICETLKRAGYRVPEHYSVCGFDNIFVSSLLTPALTTVDHRLHLRSRFAVDMIVDRGTGLAPKAPGAVSKIEYAPNLIVRGSTGRRRQR
ncbi:MAG: LacI family transcriptional regulator [Oscillospiraceae bacterium]|nr:LacI family transcriptional regulator [Oscillospiraceae bacterium]